MSNSSLVNYSIKSPNSSARSSKISAITIHHMAANLSVESCGAGFATPYRRASANYGVDSKGKVGLYVDESRRSWCSNSTSNDDRAVTIEVANCTKGPDWKVNDIALEKTIELCVDICKRNNIPYLNYTGDEGGNLTMHCWFSNTGCPGPYLASRFSYIANEVNKKLGRQDKVNNNSISVFKVGERVKVLSGAKYNTGKSCPSFFMSMTFYIREVYGNYFKIAPSKTGAISGMVHKKYLQSLDNKQPVPEEKPKEDKNPEVTPKPEDNTLKIGDKVKLKAGAKYYNGGTIPSWVFTKNLYVRRISGDRITFSIYSSGAVTGDTHHTNLIKI